MITWILLFVVLAIVGKLIYDRKRETVKPTEVEFELKDKFQTLAGIKGEKHSFSDEEIEALKSSIQNMEFPPQSESIPLNSVPITKIKPNEDSDPLGDIPLSRVSKEGKQKMAEIAMKDISNRLEETTSKFKPINLDEVVEKPVKRKRNYNRKPKK
jgi:hypothetical protein